MSRRREGVAKNPARAHVVQLCREAGRGRRQGRTARGVTNHDGAGNFASRSDGESVRDVELPAVRVLKNTWEAKVRANRLPDGLKTTTIALLTVALLTATPATAQKSGGILRLYHNDNPPSASLLEESTIASVTPFAAVFNNLVVFDPSKVHESIETVIPDLAESWSWNATNTKLTFKLRQGVKWHD